MSRGANLSRSDWKTEMNEGESNEGESEVAQQKLPGPTRSFSLPKSQILAVVAGIVIIGGFGAYVVRQNYQTTLHVWNSELSASARYQTWTLQNSLQQSQDDAQVLADFAFTKKLLLNKSAGAASSHAPDVSKQEVLNLFEEYRRIYEYGSISLFNGAGQLVVQATNPNRPNSIVDGSTLEQDLASTIRTRRYTVQLNKRVNQEVALIFMMPVASGSTAEPPRVTPDRPIGVVVIVDPFNRDLLPLLTAKSAATYKGETMLLKLEAGDASYVSPHRYAFAPSKVPIESDTLRQATTSAVHDRVIFGRFVDYRGVTVLAAMEKIPSINSVVVFKVDREAALADFRRAASIETLTAMAFLLAYLGSIVMYTRRSLAREMRERLARQRLENELLETTVAQRTSQIAQINRHLEGALSDKIVLLKEVHHRVKNNMAVIVGLLGMQADSLDNDQARTAFEESQQRVWSMASIHEYLYSTEHLDLVNFGMYVHELTNRLSASYAIRADSVVVRVEAEEIELPVDRAIPCGLILNELVSNALKYAFPNGRKGEITVHFGRLESGALTLSCRDDGVGILDDFDWKHPRSLGLQLVNILTKQIAGELMLDRGGRGTKFELRFSDRD